MADSQKVINYISNHLNHRYPIGIFVRNIINGFRSGIFEHGYKEPQTYKVMPLNRVEGDYSQLRACVRCNELLTNEKVVKLHVC
jgi:hypothetical protein